MGKAVKKIGIIVGIIASLLLIMIVISYTNHRIQLSKEESFFVPSGKMVQINSHEMNIYTEGQGEETLIFLSGGGTCSPVLDFKSLYTLLSDKYKIAVVEKSGYGFSEDADVDRDMDTILYETRKALSKAGLQAPYILFPHSMSGVEALYWAQEYPDEVKGIVGLDVAIPESYECFSINHVILKLSAFGSDIGITRFFPGIVEDSASIKHGILTEEEKDLYRIIFYRRTLTKSMVKEIKEIKSNAEKINKNSQPDIPMLFFISNGEGTGWDKDNWIEIQRSYIKTIDRGKSIELDCGHYVHDIEYEKIAEKSNRFIEEFVNTD